jgi:asparagine synthase (glutamine-hydrolysing)
MCGIFGATQSHPFSSTQLNALREARDTLVHRGPDQADEAVLGKTYIGHRRLSILDTSEAGKQPMQAGGITVAVNGEIYNFHSLRAILESAGYVFRSNSDSEVVLHGYRHWGIERLLSKLEGMYAAIVHDNNQQILYAFRDRVGIKPLYYGLHQGTLTLASELKAIKHFTGEENLSIRNDAVIDFLTYRYIPAPKTLFKNIHKLPAASLLTCRLESQDISISRYWHLNSVEKQATPDSLSEQLLALMQSSVKEQLVSDVPLGLLLSGGLDSSSVAAIAGQIQPNIRSFSIGFKDKRDETPFALEMANHARTLHNIEYLEQDAMENLNQKMDMWFDEPFADTSAIPTYQVCAFARSQVKVALSGDGGDELFGGYKWYERFASISKASQFLPFKTTHGWSLPPIAPKSLQLNLASISDPVWRYALIRGSLPHSSLQHWKLKLSVDPQYDSLWAYRNWFQPSLGMRKSAQYMDFHTYLPDDILTKVDRVSMACSLECRPPILSTELAEFAFSLPESFTYAHGQLKGGFRDTMHPFLPPAVLSHAKQGFSVPNQGWKTSRIQQFGSLQESILSYYIN